MNNMSERAEDVGVMKDEELLHLEEIDVSHTRWRGGRGEGRGVD
jgi:hypothetical protein